MGELGRFSSAHCEGCAGRPGASQTFLREEAVLLLAEAHDLNIEDLTWSYI